MTATCPAVYLDHGATSWPKPPGVTDAVVHAIEACGGNPGRGAHSLSLAASRLVFEARRDLASLLGVSDSRDLLFQSGCTEATNLMLKGLLKPGDRVVVSSMEHNAVSRPLHVLAQRGVQVAVVNADATGLIDPARVREAVTAAPTRAVVCLHASNVTGTIQPIADIAEVAHAAGALMLVDGAQAAGHLALDLASLGADAYAMSGHKALLGPQGVGLLHLGPETDAEELLQGGTGGASAEDSGQPTTRPDRYEAGTLNTPGIAGLAAAARFLLAEGEAVRAEEARLARRLHEGLRALPGLRVLGPPPELERVPVLSVTHDRVDADRIVWRLDRDFGIAARAGLHCAPQAHRTLGTLATGAVRFGVGFGVTADGIDAALAAIAEILADAT